ncbi:MAG TPA: hypothetical protein VN193_04135 [Candidatus Angelobacter sp.]|jgi:hypothetical protein|nr:hypothetical protein [Candidatus Angelobacter sp.]
MTQPSPCPRCGGARAWSGAPEGHTVPVLCVDCGREATACPRCGWEWTGLPRDPLLARRGTCVSCRVIHLAGQNARREDVPAAFAERAQRSRLLQRLADAGEAESESRWRSYRVFGDVAEWARRRAEAVVRLEIELRGIDARVR